jgi:hypothetical protein
MKKRRAVDSTKYSEDEGFVEDDEAFFEQLEEMTARIDAESGTDDDDTVEQTDVSVGLRRSSHTIRAPQRLIEESGVSMDKKPPDWKDCLIMMYETTLVGAWVKSFK